MQRTMRVTMLIPESEAGSILLDLSARNISLVFEEAKKTDPRNRLMARAPTDSGALNGMALAHAIAEYVKAHGPTDKRALMEVLGVERLNTISNSLTMGRKAGIIQKGAFRKWHAVDKVPLHAEPAPTEKRPRSNDHAAPREGLRTKEQGDEFRLKILRSLAKGPKRARDLQTDLSETTSAITWYGIGLRKTGMITSTAQGWQITKKGENQLAKHQ